MKSAKLITLVSLSLLNFTGCTSYVNNYIKNYETDYDISLQEVDSPKQKNERYGQRLVLKSCI